MSLAVVLCGVVLCLVAWRTIGTQSLGKRTYGLSAVAGPPRAHWLTGNLMQIMKDGLEYTLGLFERYGGVVKVYGVLGVEQLFLHDPLALQHILVKDQDAFEETDMFIETNKLLFGEGLIATLGEQHKKQRRLLNPVFSLANLRRVLPRIQPIANEVVDRLRDTLPKDGGPREIDLLPWIKKATIEYVARGIIGVSLDSLEPTEASEYTNAICSVSQVAMRVVFIRPLIPWVVRNISLYWRNKLVDWLPLPALRELRCLSEVMEKSSREAYLAKKAEVNQSGGSDRSHGDLMSIMLRANASSLAQSQLTETELLGQINTFVLAGQETSTSSLGRLLHVLAREQDAQRRLRSEVRDAKTRHALACGMEASEWESVSLPYDILTGLPYLDAVVRETLRLHPPTSIMNRVATKDSVLPLQYPICSATGEQVSTVYVPKGTNVMISILGANRDKHVWGQDADEWRPERWLTASYDGINATSPGARIVSEFGEESVASSVDEQGSSNKDRADIRYPGVFGSMMTFFGGSRACIGFKFAEMEIKQVLSTLLSTMHFALPSAVDAQGVLKEIYWRLDGIQVPVVRPPHGDSKIPQVPLDVRLVRDGDFV